MNDYPKPRAIVMPPMRQQLGLPSGPIVQTFHNTASRTTITEIAVKGVPPIHTLYWRRAGDSTYMLLCKMEPNRSLENAVNCHAPWAFARIVEWTRVGRGYGGNSLDLMRISLADVPTLERVDLTDILPIDATIEHLLRADDSGTRLDVRMCMRDLTSSDSGRLRRAVCVIDLASRTMKELDALPGLEV